MSKKKIVTNFFPESAEKRLEAIFLGVSKFEVRRGEGMNVSKSIGPIFFFKSSKKRIETIFGIDIFGGRGRGPVIRQLGRFQRVISCTIYSFEAPLCI